MHLTANLPRNLPVQKFLKPVKIWQNYGHESVAQFFGPPCMYTGWAKNRGHRLITIILSNLSRLLKNFTGIFLSKIAVKWSSCSLPTGKVLYSCMWLLLSSPVDTAAGPRIIGVRAIFWRRGAGSILPEKYRAAPEKWTPELTWLNTTRQESLTTPIVENRWRTYIYIYIYIFHIFHL